MNPNNQFINRSINKESEGASIRKLTNILVLMSIWCTASICMRVFITGKHYYLFLVWNLILAIAPSIFAYSALKVFDAKQRLGIRISILFGCWLLFFPNAPYIITDFIHLGKTQGISIWYDIVLLFSFAFAGLYSGYCSLFIIHHILKSKMNYSIAWCIIGVLSILCGFGIYLGRIRRWNSWDLITQTEYLFKDILLQLTNIEAWKMTILFSLFMFCSYILFYKAFQYLTIKNNEKI